MYTYGACDRPNGSTLNMYSWPRKLNSSSVHAASFKCTWWYPERWSRVDMQPVLRAASGATTSCSVLYWNGLYARSRFSKRASYTGRFLPDALLTTKSGAHSRGHVPTNGHSIATPACKAGTSHCATNSSSAGSNSRLLMKPGGG